MQVQLKKGVMDMLVLALLSLFMIIPILREMIQQQKLLMEQFTV